MGLGGTGDCLFQCASELGHDTEIILKHVCQRCLEKKMGDSI